MAQGLFANFTHNINKISGNLCPLAVWHLQTFDYFLAAKQASPKTLCSTYAALPFNSTIFSYCC